MNPYVIVTDSCADMVPGFAAENHIVELELTYTIGGVTRPCNDPSLSRPAFYDMVRAGAGSEKAARENLSAVLGALSHGLKMLAGEGH